MTKVGSNIYPLIRAVAQGTDWRKRIATPTTFSISPQIQSLLSRPTWSVKSLLPPEEWKGPMYYVPGDPGYNPRGIQDARAESSADTMFAEDSGTGTDAKADTEVDFKEGSPSTDQDDREITYEKMRHLLRLSALPQPSKREEAALFSTLKNQIHFVKEMQKVDTEGLAPLIAIRDETEEARMENTITLADLQKTLDEEVKIGRNGTVRRKKPEELEQEERDRELVDETGAGGNDANSFTHDQPSFNQFSVEEGSSDQDTTGLDESTIQALKELQMTVDALNEEKSYSDTRSRVGPTEQDRQEAQQSEDERMTEFEEYLDSTSEKDFFRLELGEPWRLDPFSLGGDVKQRAAGRYFVVKKGSGRKATDQGIEMDGPP